MRKITTEIVIVILLWIFVISSLIYNPQFGVQFIFGIVSLTFASAALLFGHKDLGLGILTFALILSTFNAIKFSEAFEAHIGFVMLIPLILLIILIFSRLRELINLREKWFGAEPAEVEKAQENRVNFFRREFQNLSSEELVRRGNNDKLVDEARIAIDQILNERNVTLNK
ncbi:hypothetical protein [Flavobacterium sp. N3904]|uniref:hypothetical protein n=1 Tax=Flavobacterium sp. N3904 TaxID=2986835 RepID=UPI0022256B94|nr:hypothetical protein [Flavobacterium sp. N3904]